MGNVNMEAYQVHYKGDESVADHLRKIDLDVEKAAALPDLPTTEGKTVLTAVTDSQGDTELTYETPEVESEDIAPEFSEEGAYSEGDLVYYDGILYKFAADHTAGVWDPSEVTQTTVSAEFNELKNTLTDSVSVTGSLDDTNTTLLNKLYAAIDVSRISRHSIIINNDVVYRCCNTATMEFTVLIPYFSSSQAFFDATKITLNSSTSTEKYIRFRSNVGAGEYTSPTGNVTDISNNSSYNKTYTLYYG